MKQHDSITYVHTYIYIYIYIYICMYVPSSLINNKEIYLNMYICMYVYLKQNIQLTSE